MKFIKNNTLKSLLITPVIVSPLLLTISCSQSNSMDSKIDSLTDKETLFNINVSSNIKKVSDIFTLNKEVLTIEESQDLKDWNSNLSEEDKLNYTIEPKIISINIPDINQMNSINVFVDVSAGNIKKIITKTLDISNLIPIALGIDNVMKPIENELMANIVWKTIHNNVKNYLIEKNISASNNETPESLSEKFNFTFEKSNDPKKDGYFIDQSNLNCSFDSSNEIGVYLNLYTGKKYDVSDIDSIKKECVVYQIFIPFLQMGGNK